MISRREVIASGLAVSFLARTSAASLTGVATATDTRAVRNLVADDRFPEARSAARSAEVQGAAILRLADDVTGLYESLDLALRSAPFAIAGLTTKNALFVFERLGWERGLRTVYRGIHRRAADGAFQHELLGSPAVISRIDDPMTTDWAAVLGRALAAWAAGPRDAHQIVPSQTLPGADGATLASWLLVPKDNVEQRA